VDAAVVGLAEQGFKDVRPVHDFALRAIAAGADSASELGRSLSVSKQAAAKTIATLLERGYVAREEDPADRRRKRIEVTPLGFEVMRTGEAIIDNLRESWRVQLGEAELETLEAQLSAFVGDAPVRIEAPGWVALELDGR
jgi:DNA-binding MarR family transcriptional regulator